MKKSPNQALLPTLGEESKMDINEAKVKYEEALAEKTQVLIFEIRRMICERPFLLDPGVTKQYVDGIHFEYEYDSFVPAACPLCGFR
jgi:hypothetical protein